MKTITILLVDDHTIMREGLRGLLEQEEDFEVIGEAQDGRQAIDLAEHLKPDVVLMDIAMPKLNGLEATRQLLKAVPSTKVVILSGHDRFFYVRNAIECGASGYLLKQTPGRELARAVREVNSGRQFFSTSDSQDGSTVDSKTLRMKWPNQADEIHLTPRELEVLQKVAESKANKEAAWELGIATKTVEKHRSNLMTKLGVHDAAGLTRYAISVGIVESGIQLSIH